MNSMSDERAPASSSSAGGASLGHSVIPIVNKLQDIFAQLGSESTIELPQVAVVGSQSSGKSSVLEALVGRDFLPRGNDICTRRPLVLQLVHGKRTADGTEEEWGEFLHKPGKRFFDFNEIRREIQAETEKEAGVNKCVSDKKIRLKIVSPNVVDITLIDLPGLTKVPVGDQPHDIEARIRTMIMSYIKQKSCVILAVTPANIDLPNSDALQMAGNADPDGCRTIGVITKLDIMDRGTDARDLLLGKVIPLRLGYVGVVNRCQEDILLERSIKDALIAEERFFQSCPVYNDLADSCGVPQLAKKLNQILVQNIKTVLPGLKSDISAALVSVAKEYASFGEITESKASQGTILLNILSKYSKAFCSMIEGKNEEMSTSQLSGGARIHYIFQNIFVKSLEDVDPCEDLTDNNIRATVRNASGPSAALFISEVPFEVIVRRQISHLLDPSLQCARFIYDELIEMSRCCMVNELKRFPVLQKRMDDVIRNFMREGLEPSETIIRHIIEMEMDYINITHPNFIGGSKALEMASQQIKSSRIAASISRKKDTGDSETAPNSERTMMSRTILARHVNGGVPDLKKGVGPVADVERTAPAVSNGGSTWGISSIFGGHYNRTSAQESSTSKPLNEPVQSTERRNSMILLREPPSILRPSEVHSDQEAIEATKLLVRSYYDIVRKSIEDLVPKAIMHFLVNHTKRDLHNVFIKKLYRDKLFEEILQESDEVTMKRKRTVETLEVLERSLQTLDELPLEAETVETDTTGLPKIPVHQTSHLYNASGNGYEESRNDSPQDSKPRKSSHSGELYAYSNGGGRSSGLGLYM